MLGFPIVMNIPFLKYIDNAFVRRQRLFCTFILFLLFAITPVYVGAQSITVVTRNPMPASLNEWQTDRSLIQVIIVNSLGSPERRNCRLAYVLKEAGGNKVIAQSENNSPNMPRFTIPAGPSTIIRFGNDIVNGNAISFDQSIRTKVITTNSLPEGNFDFCVTLIDEQGNTIGESGNLCRFFTIIIPDPPTLIAPQHLQTLVHGTLPVFSWTPVMSSSIGIIRYSIKICPVFQGQNDRFAIDNNPILHEKKGIEMTSYMYPPSGLLPNTYAGAIGFVWQVQALDKNGVPATRNNGKSEIFRYTFRDAKDIVYNPTDDSSGVVNNDAKRYGGSDDKKNTGNLTGGTSNKQNYSSIRINEFTLSLRQPLQCNNNECTFSGQAKTLLPFSDDSVLVDCRDLRIRVMNNTLIAYGGKAVYAWKKSPLTSTALTIQPRSLEITADKNTIEGDIYIDWTATGLKSTSKKFPFLTSFNKNGIDQTNISIAERFYINNKPSDCVYLQCDTAVVSYSFKEQKTLKADVRGAVHFDCNEGNETDILGRVQIPLDEPNSDNLLFVLQSGVHKFVLKNTPMIVEASTLWVDFSTDANFSGVRIMPQCAMNGANNPIWRGIIVPEGAVLTKIGEGEIQIPATDLILDNKDKGIVASFMSRALIGTSAKLGGFLVKVDSAYVSVCRNNPLDIRYTGTLSIASAGYEISPEMKIFNELPLILNTDGAWKIRGLFTLQQKGELINFGGRSSIRISKGLFTLSGNNTGIVRLYSNKVSLTPDSKEQYDFPEIFIRSNGVAGFSENSWKQLSSRALCTFDSYKTEIEEFGFGYYDKTFWMGFSGDFIFEESSGLTKIPLKHVKVSANDKGTVESEKVESDILIGGAIPAKIESMWNYSKGSERGGLNAIGTISLPWLDGEKIPITFFASSEKNIPYWIMRASYIFDSEQMLANGLFVKAMSLNLGWNAKVDNVSDAVLENLLSGGEMPLSKQPTIELSEFYCKGVAIAGDKTLNHLRSAFMFNHRQGNKSGTLGAIVDVQSKILYLPSLTFASGQLHGEWNGLQKPTEITLIGRVFIDVLNDEKKETDAHFLFDSKGMTAKLGSFSTVIKGMKSNGDDNGIQAMTSLQCDNCFWELTERKIQLKGDTKVWSGISGIPNEQQVPLTLLGVSDKNICFTTDFSFEQNKIVMKTRFGISTNADVFTSFDIFPCLPTLSLMSFSSLEKTIKEDSKGTITISPTGTNSCQPITLMLSDATTQSMTEISSTGESSLINLSTDDKKITFHKPQKSISTIAAYVNGNFSGKMLNVEINNLENKGCGEKAGAANYNKNAFDISVNLNNNGTIVNKGKKLQSGTMVKIEAKYYEGTLLKTINKTVRLKDDIETGLSLPVSDFIKIPKHRRLVMISVFPIGIDDIIPSDNCYSEVGTLCR